MQHPLRALTLDELRTRRSLKWQLHAPDVLPLWVAEMDAPLAEPIVTTVTDALRRGDTGYAFGTDYAEAYAGFAADRWGWPLPVGRTRLVPDVMSGVVEVLELVTAPGDGVVVNPPVYPPFHAFVRHRGRRPVEAPLGPDGRLDLEVLAAAFARPDVTAHLLCSPQNPTGTVHTAEELRAVAELAAAHDVRVVVDEIHAPLVLPGARFVPYLSLPEAQRGFSLLSASKAWNLAGLKAAIAVAGAEAADDLARMPEEASHGANHVGVLAHVAALRDGRAWLDGLLEDLVDNRQLLADLLARHVPGARYRPGEATYLAWVDLRDAGFGDDPAAELLERAAVAFTHGPPFGARGVGHVRINLGTNPAIITEAVERVAAVR